MIRSWKGYRFVSEMSLSRDVLITLIRSEHGYRYVIKMSLLSTLSFKKVKLTLMSMSMFLTWSRMPWKYQESCILTQCSAKIVIRYILHQGKLRTLAPRIVSFSVIPGRSPLFQHSRLVPEWPRMTGWETGWPLPGPFSSRHSWSSPVIPNPSLSFRRDGDTSHSKSSHIIPGNGMGDF